MFTNHHATAFLWLLASSAAVFLAAFLIAEQPSTALAVTALDALLKAVAVTLYYVWPQRGGRRAPTDDDRVKSGAHHF